MTEGEVAIAIAKYYGLRSLILVQNCMGITDHEADLLRVTPSMYLEEIEIKVSVADFKAEFVTPSYSKQYKHEDMRSHHSLIKRYYIAMPNEVYVKVQELIPDHAGVFVIYADSKGLYASKQKPAQDFKNVRALGAKELMKMSAMACSRLWSYKAKGTCGRR